MTATFLYWRLSFNSNVFFKTMPFRIPPTTKILPAVIWQEVKLFGSTIWDSICSLKNFCCLKSSKKMLCDWGFNQYREFRPLWLYFWILDGSFPAFLCSVKRPGFLPLSWPINSASYRRVSCIFLLSGISKSTIAERSIDSSIGFSPAYCPRELSILGGP